MGDHIRGFHSVISQLTAKTRNELDDIVEDAEREFLIYLVVLGVFVLGCLVLTIWYVYCMKIITDFLDEELMY